MCTFKEINFQNYVAEWLNNEDGGTDIRLFISGGMTSTAAQIFGT